MAEEQDLSRSVSTSSDVAEDAVLVNDETLCNDAPISLEAITRLVEPAG